MNKDQVKGRAKEVKGSVKEAAGTATGKDDLARRGTAEKVAGKVQAEYGDAKHAIKKGK